MKKLLTSILLASVISFNQESQASIPQPKKYSPNKKIRESYNPNIRAYNLPLYITIPVPELPKSLN